MADSVRILIAAPTAEERKHLASLVDAAGFRVVHEGPELDHDGWDVVVAACSQPTGPVADQLVAIERRRGGFPLVLVVPELTEAMATFAHGHGARTCLAAHGPTPLRLAIERATDDCPEPTREASERLRALVHQSVSDVVFHLGIEDGRFRFVEVNPVFLKATGLAEEQVVGKWVDEVIPEPSLSLVLANYRTAIAEQRTVRWEEVTRYPAGTKYGEVSVTPLVDDDGRAVRLVGTVHDVTEERVLGQEVARYADIVRSVQIALTVWNLPGEPGADRLTLAAFNPAASVLFGRDLTGALGSPIQALFAEDTDVVLALVRAVLDEGTVRELPWFRSMRDARSFAAKAFPLPGDCVGLALEDVTAPARARAVAAAEQRVLEMVARGAPLGATLESLTLAVEDELPDAIASVLLVSADGARLERGAAPHLPEEYSQAIDGAAIGPKGGSCGTAAALGRPVIVEDIGTDPLWDDYRELADRFGLRSCWAMPISASSGRVLGTFAIYYREPRTPSQADLELLARITHVAGITIRRHELDQQLRSLTAHVEAAREEERASIAREIHDQLGQSLTVMKMDVGWIIRRVAPPGSLATETLLERLHMLTRTADDVIDEVRRIAAELRPPILEHAGLGAAITWKTEETAQRAGMTAKVTCSPEADAGLDRGMAIAIFRVLQEALTNVLRHAHARHLEVTLEPTADGVKLEVRDDGRGITAQEIESPRALGLLGMRERARRMGGVISFARGEPRGTVVTLLVPLSDRSVRA